MARSIQQVPVGRCCGGVLLQVVSRGTMPGTRKYLSRRLANLRLITRPRLSPPQRWAALLRKGRCEASLIRVSSTGIIKLMYCRWFGGVVPGSSWLDWLVGAQREWPVEEKKERERCLCQDSRRHHANPSVCPSGWWIHFRFILSTAPTSDMAAGLTRVRQLQQDLVPARATHCIEAVPNTDDGSLFVAANDGHCPVPLFVGLGDCSLLRFCTISHHLSRLSYCAGASSCSVHADAFSAAAGPFFLLFSLFPFLSFPPSPSKSPPRARKITFSRR